MRELCWLIEFFFVQLQHQKEIQTISFPAKFSMKIIKQITKREREMTTSSLCVYLHNAQKIVISSSTILIPVITNICLHIFFLLYLFQ